MNDKFDMLKQTSARDLSTSSLSRLARTSKHHRALFQPLLDERKLLHHVVRGEHDAVKAMLAQDINLLFKKSIVTDCSGRTFDHISPFEYALWALDKHMWDTMLTCIPQNQSGYEVLAQLRSQYQSLQIAENALEEKEENLQIKGVTYRLNGKVITEPHFDFKNTIIRELQTYVDSYEAPGKMDWDTINKQWIEGVGSAQRLLPVHVVNEYCAPTSFHPVPAFNSYPGSSKRFYYWPTEWDGSWFNDYHGLGEEFGIVRGRRSYALGMRYPSSGDGVGCVDLDLVAMTALCKIRTNDFTNLESQLEERLNKALKTQLEVSPKSQGECAIPGLARRELEKFADDNPYAILSMNP